MLFGEVENHALCFFTIQLHKIFFCPLNLFYISLALKIPIIYELIMDRNMWWNAFPDSVAAEPNIQKIDHFKELDNILNVSLTGMVIKGFSLFVHYLTLETWLQSVEKVEPILVCINHTLQLAR